MKYLHKVKPVKSGITPDETREVLQDVIELMFKKNVIKKKDLKDTTQKILNRFEEEQALIRGGKINGAI